MLTVADIMTPAPTTAQRDTTLGDMIRLMKAHACRQIPVVDGDRLIGIVTDRDIRLAMNSPFVLHERSQEQAMLNSIIAEACMTANPMTIEPTAPATTAAKLMRTYKFGSLPVVDQGRLVGIVTVSDVLSSYITLITSLQERSG